MKGADRVEDWEGRPFLVRRINDVLWLAERLPFGETVPILRTDSGWVVVTDTPGVGETLDEAGVAAFNPPPDRLWWAAVVEHLDSPTGGCTEAPIGGDPDG